MIISPCHHPNPNPPPPPPPFQSSLLSGRADGVELPRALEEGQGGAGGEEAPFEAAQVLGDLEEPLVGGALCG